MSIKRCLLIPTDLGPWLHGREAAGSPNRDALAKRYDEDCTAPACTQTESRQCSGNAGPNLNDKCIEEGWQIAVLLKREEKPSMFFLPQLFDYN